MFAPTWKIIPISAVLLLGGTPAAIAVTPVTETVAAGSTSATLTYAKASDYQATGLHIAIARAGTTVLDAPVSAKACPEPHCLPAGLSSGGSAPSLTVRDVTGDAEPEVLLQLFTGGAHCCNVLQAFTWNGTTYAPTTKDFGDAGFTIGDVDHDGVPDFRTYDDAFAYRFTSYAASVLPLEVDDLVGGAFVDVTARVPALVRVDAIQAWRLAQRVCRQRLATLGAYGAWAADEYRLHRRASALRTLRAVQRRGCLIDDGAPFTRAKGFLHTLDRYLQSRAAFRNR